LKTGKSTFAEMLGGTMPKLSVDISLSDNEHLLIGDESFQVIATPGHSLGSICLYTNKRKILFSGDTVFAHGGFGRYDFPGGDFYALAQSLKKLAALDVVDLYPGHGPVHILPEQHH
jgi:glyoxylase-like metal-dependent hydrolase (beta-lactamase superfamily II)